MTSDRDMSTVTKRKKTSDRREVAISVEFAQRVEDVEHKQVNKGWCCLLL